MPPSTAKARLSEQQHDAGRQQQDEHDPAELRLIEPSIKLQPEPRADEQDGEGANEQPPHVTRDRALAAEPGGGHGEGGDPDRLKYGALFILRPAAQLAPDCRDDSGKAGGAAKRAVEEARAGIGNGAAEGERLERRPQQTIEAKQYQHDADADPQMLRVGVRQREDADWHAE